MANVVLFAAILLAATAATHADKKKIVVPHRPGGPPSEYKRCILIDVRVNFTRLGLLLLLLVLPCKIRNTVFRENSTVDSMRTRLSMVRATLNNEHSLASQPQPTPARTASV